MIKEDSGSAAKCIFLTQFLQVLNYEILKASGRNMFPGSSCRHRSEVHNHRLIGLEENSGAFLHYTHLTDENVAVQRRIRVYPRSHSFLGQSWDWTKVT